MTRLDTEIKEQLYDPDTPRYDSQLIDDAKKHFGVTKNPNEGGYILPDGTMLDLSGRYYATGYLNKKPLPGKPDYLKNQRSVDHRELGGLVSRGGTYGMLEFMKNTGAIRMAVIGGDNNIAFFEFQTITPAQKKTLSTITNYFGGKILYDIWDAKGDTIKSGTVTSINKIKLYDPYATAFDKRVIKSKLVNFLESKGFHVSATDTPSIVVFTDKPVNEKSYKYSKQANLKEPYLTSFGVKGALKYMGKEKLFDPESQSKLKGIIHYAIDKLFDPHRRKGTLIIGKDQPIFFKEKGHKAKEWVKELKAKAHAGKKLKGQQRLTGAVSTSKRLDEFAYDVKGIKAWLRQKGIEPDTIDVEGEYDHNLSHTENLQHFKDLISTTDKDAHIDVTKPAACSHAQRLQAEIKVREDKAQVTDMKAQLKDEKDTCKCNPKSNACNHTATIKEEIAHAEAQSGIPDLKEQLKDAKTLCTCAECHQMGLYDPAPVTYAELDGGDMLLKDGLIIQRTLSPDITVGYKPGRKVLGNISTPDDVYRILWNMPDFDREYGKVLHLNNKNQVVGIETVSIGSINAAVVHPREVFKRAILDNSAGIIFVHNHPSGDPTPSNEDFEITKRLIGTGKTVGIDLVDSVVIGTEGRTYSFRGQGYNNISWAAMMYDPAPGGKFMKTKFKLPYRVDVWEERDRLIITVYDAKDQEVASWIDDDAREMFEDGFFDSRNLEESVLEYLQSVGTIKSYDPAALKITGTKSKMQRLKKHLEKEHPSTKGHMRVNDPAQTFDPAPKAKYQIGDKVHLKGHGMVKVIGVKESLDRIMYRVSFPKTGLKPREYDEYDLDYKYSKESLEARKEAGLPYDSAPNPTTQLHPPRGWFTAMYKGIVKRSDVTNPAAIVINIWKRLKPAKRAEIADREAKGERFHYDLPLPDDRPTKGIGTLRMVKPFHLVEAQVNVSGKDFDAVRRSGIFKLMRRGDGSTAMVARCKSKTPVNIFVDKA